MFLALFNSQYIRQFELTISKKAWKKTLKRHKNNPAEAAEVLFLTVYRPKTTTSIKKRRAFRDFISYNFRNLGGEAQLVIDDSKEAYLRRRMKRRGLGNIEVTYLGRGEMRAKRRFK